MSDPQHYSTIAGAGRFTEVKRASTILLLVITAVVIALFAWASMAEVETVTRAEGKVVPSGHLQVVQSLEGGIVEQIVVREGDKVAQGALLVALSAAQFGADLEARSQQLHALKARVVRLAAQAEDNKPLFEPLTDEGIGQEFISNESATYWSMKREQTSQIAILDAQISQRLNELQEAEVVRKTTEKTLGIAREEREIVAQMVERGLEPKLELVRLDRMIADAEGKSQTATVAIDRIEASIKETQSRKQATEQQFQAEAAAELSKSQAELRALEESLPALQDKVERAELRAPAAGIVNRVMVSSLGGVIRPGDVVVEIVPENDQLLVEALVQPKDIAFIDVGHPAKVKISAYDFSLYGALDGTVMGISADAVPTGEQGQPFFKVKIETASTTIESLGRQLPITPGMQAQVDIITGSKTILNYLSKPLLGVKENAFRER